MSEYDKIQAYFKILVEKYGDEEKERQANLRYCDGSKQMYYEKCIRLENDLNAVRLVSKTMTDLHSKVCDCVSHLIGIAQFSNSEASMKNTTKGLNFMYMNAGLDQNYLKILVGFYNYIKQYKLHISEHIEMYKLAKLISVVRNPPKKFPIGTYVCHTRHGFKDCSPCFTPDNVTYEYGIVDDYDYTVNQYQLKYDNGSTVGWIPEKHLKQIEK